jgi:hypothetical protein
MDNEIGTACGMLAAAGIIVDLAAPALTVCVFFGFYCS